jgi:hypothetical protein
MGFAVWINRRGTLAWARGTHEYRPMGTAVIAGSDQFRHRDFQQTRKRPADLDKCFIGFFGSLEEVNVTLRKQPAWNRRPTPAHLR